MITWTSKDYLNPEGRYHQEGVCLSTDTKPTAGVANGDMLLEMDTGDIYCYDADSSAWGKLGGE